eukprot:77326-Chlamydomonas_euryale.AAC.1
MPRTVCSVASRKQSTHVAYGRTRSSCLNPKPCPARNPDQGLNPKPSHRDMVGSIGGPPMRPGLWFNALVCTVSRASWRACTRGS